nr:reverse transcriptase domain-containing protein [Tanacetum cinerariifolium]
MDQMLERLAGNQYYCFLDGFSGYFRIPIDLKDQEKTTFTANTERLLIVGCLLGYAMHQSTLASSQISDSKLAFVSLTTYGSPLIVYQLESYRECMRTRSNFYPSNSTANIPRRSNRRRIPNIVETEIQTIAEIIPMADRTMKELLQAPTEGYGEAIVIPEILAENFEIKINLLQLVQANKFHGRENDNPHTHISNFKRMTATLKYRDVPNEAIKLMLFSYSLEDRARIWYEKEPPNLILTWDDLVNKFVNQFFPPSKTTHLKNEISRFTQRFEETFSEAWDHFKELLRACPHHGFLKLTQIDTFYNGLTKQDQDSLNAASGGNLLNKTTREALQIIENKSKVRYSRSKSNVSRVNTNSRDVVSKTNDPVEKTCVTCGGAHAYYECIATDSIPSSVYAATGSYNQVPPSNQASHQIPPPGFAPGKMKAVTTRSGLAYDGLSIPTKSPHEKVDEQIIEEILDKEHSNSSGSTAQVQPLIVPISIPEPDVPRTQTKPSILYPSRDGELTPTRMTLELVDRSITRPKGVTEDVFVKMGKFHFLTDFIVVDFKSDPRVPLILGRSFLRTGRDLIDVYGEEITLRYNPKSSSPTLETDDLISESNASKVPFVKSSSPTLTPFGENLFSLPTMDLKLAEESKEKYSIEEPPELELKELPSHLEYAFLEDSNKLAVIIAKNLKVDEREALINVLKSHKRAIA